MVKDSILDELASAQLSLILGPQAEQQSIDGETAYFCPFCKGKDGGGATPHFIVYRKQMCGYYGKEVGRWMCTHTKQGGYGAIELFAAIKGKGYWWRPNSHAAMRFVCEGEDLRQACLGLMRLGGWTDERIKEKLPSVMARDYRTVASQPQSILTYEPKADFSSHDLYALGCSSWFDKDNVLRYGFDCYGESKWHFNPQMITKDFRIMPVLSAVLPAVNRSGKAQSERIWSTPWNPLFVVLAADGGSASECGALLRPAMDNAPMVFCNTDEHTAAKVSRWLGGDRVFTHAVELRTSDNTGVRRAIDENDHEEKVSETRKVWIEDVNEKGKSTMVQKDVDIPDHEIKARNVIYCPLAQDAVAAYYHLKRMRYQYPTAFGDRWYHVCFPFGQTPFSSVHFNKMSRFAENVYTLFPSDPKETLKARAISCRYRHVLRAELPLTFADIAHQYSQRLYCHNVNTVRDFFLTYKMLAREAYQHDYDLDRLFSSCVSSALSSDPFIRKEKRDRYGFVVDVSYVINPATLWEFMASAGYARDVRPDETNKIGRYVHVDGPFADELDASSMVQATVDHLKAYAKQLNNSNLGQPDEYELMVQAVLRANKEINEKTIASLPAVHLNYTGGYGKQLDHFFYQNGALEITPETIRMVSYENLDFNVERNEQMEWNVSLPKSLPFFIQENPDYRTRMDALQEKRVAKDENGKPLFTMQEINKEENDLNIWAQSHRWIVDWRGKTEKEMWRPLQVLRGFANEEWEEEMALVHDGKQFSPEEQMDLDNRFANLIFCLGRVLWRYRDSNSNCIPYLIENSVSAANKAEGGSGKSTLVRVFAGCAGHILNVDGRDINHNKEFAANLAEYVLHKHRLVHWEDVDQSFDIGKLYNLATGGFSVKKLYVDKFTIPLSEGPGHICTSNYPLHDIDDSTMRRVCLGGFSHRFCGANMLKNKVARRITDVMPDFTMSPEKLSTESRNQIAMICAAAVQFVMRYDVKVDAQKKYMEQRTLTQSLGEAFLRFARVFFAQETIYGVPIDLDSMLDEYKNDYAEASKNKTDSFSPKAFKRRLADYCETMGIQMNPPQLFRKAGGQVLKKYEQRNYFCRQAWCTRRFFVGKDWEDDATVQPKQIRELAHTEHAVYFFRTGKDAIPSDYDALQDSYQKFIQQPDPTPILDDQGNPVSLTEDEKTRWRSYLDSRQRKRIPLSATPAMPEKAEEVKDEDLPF